MEKNLKNGSLSLEEHDPELFDLIKKEENRQRVGLELVASENYTSRAVMDCQGSCLTNKYSEGNVGARYYGGNEYIDKIEQLCIDRALKVFGLDDKVWGANVQPYSGSPANLGVLMGLLNPGDKIMGLDLPSGGHLTHGYQTEKKKISSTSVIFESKSYRSNPETGLFDYDDIRKTVLEFKPKLLFAGYSAYPRDLDYKKFREMADEVGAILMVDMAHYSGLVATKLLNQPFEYADVCTSTTHKTLRGPRAGMILYRLKYKAKIDFAVFPGLQGGPHNHKIAGLATQLKEVNTEHFREYSRQVIKNAQAMCESFMKRGYKIVTNGTENHIVLLDVRPLGLTGSKVEKVCDYVHITVNKNAIYGDKSALTPGGVRMGTPAVTTRGMYEKDMDVIAGFVERVLKICVSIQETSGKMLKDFVVGVEKSEEVKELSKDVQEFSAPFYLPGKFL